MDLELEATGIDTTVRRWWRAWETKELRVLEELAVEDYVEFTGHSEAPRVSRAVLLEVAARAFQRFTITSWEIIYPIVRREGDVAVVAYRWIEQTTVEGQAVSLEGVATDVLVRRDGVWRYLSHHSTTTNTSSAC